MRFPIFALIAPLIASVVLWAVTGSAYTLLFALLGPVMALAQFGDSVLQARRSSRKREAEREDKELEAVQLEYVQREHERQRQLSDYPSAVMYCYSNSLFRPRWAAGDVVPGQQRTVRVGVTVGDGFPYLLDLSAGLAVRGDDIEVASVLRAIVAQLCWTWGVAEAFRVEQDLATQPEWKALDSPDHSRLSTLVFRVDNKSPLPSGVRYLLTVDSGRASVVDTVMQIGGDIPLREFECDLLTRAQVQPFIERLQSELIAQQSPTRSGLPTHVSARLLDAEDFQSCRDTLVVCVGEQATQPLFLDLVSAGPHAVITGMTGSGKTEFLRAWLVALCCSYPPSELSILIVDFKGGAGFQDLGTLPHVSPVVTDLDTREVHRAVMSLRAEIRYREHILLDHAVTDIRDVPLSSELTRLIVVVDEYRALLERFPECAQLFSDLTARGRALGIHVLLSSQQVGGAVSDAVLANCALRLSFRVAQKQDSLALLGSDDAHTLEHIPGRGMVMGTGLALREFQAPLPTDQDFGHVAARAAQWVVSHPEWQHRKPWLAPLPSRIDAKNMPQEVPGAAWLGLADIPSHQLQSWVQYLPSRDGNVRLCGPARSGLSSALRLLAGQFTTSIITDAEQAWDAVVEHQNSPGEFLLIDDLETIMEEFSLEHREEFLRCLMVRARELPRHGGAFIASYPESALSFGGLGRLFSSQLSFEDARIPGRAQWDGHDVQLVFSPPCIAESAPPAQVEFESGHEYLVITRRVSQVRAALSARYPHRVTTLQSSLTVFPGAGGIIIGTPDAWLSRSSLLEERRERAVLILDSCTVSELRSLRLRPGLFPHVDQGKVLVVDAVGDVKRAFFEN